MFDDFTARANQVSNIQGADAFTFVGADTTRLYAGTTNIFPDSFYRLALDANGLSIIDETQNIDGGALDSDGRFIFVSNGKVIDPTTKTDKTTLQLDGFSSGVRVDAAASRSYFAEVRTLGSIGLVSGAQIEALDNSTGGLIGNIQFQGIGISTAATPLLRWGADGLALQMTSLAGGQSSVAILRSTLTSRPAQPAFHISGPGTNGYIPPVTIAAGATATFNLTLTADAGFAGQITLACSALPVASTCSPSPATLTVPSAGALTTAVTISTTKQVAAVRPGTLRWKGTVAFAVMLFGPLGLISLRGNRRRSWTAIFCLATLLVASAIAGCGGAGGSMPPPPPPPPNFTSAGTYNVVFTASSGTVSRQVNLTVVVQ